VERNIEVGDRGGQDTTAPGRPKTTAGGRLSATARDRLRELVGVR
jgi:hypothetical protein